MASGNHLRERLARLESKLEQQDRLLASLWRRQKSLEKVQQHMRTVLIVAAAIGLQHSDPLAKLLLGFVR